MPVRSPRDGADAAGDRTQRARTVRQPDAHHVGRHADTGTGRCVQPVTGGCASRCKRRDPAQVTATATTSAAVFSRAGSGGAGHVLGPLAVLVDVGLARELAQLEHDLVGDPPEDERVVGPVRVATEVERARDPDGHRPEQVGHDLTDRLCLPRADHGHGQHGHPALQRQPGHAGVALVQPAVRRAGPLRVDAEQAAALEHLPGRIERPLGGRASPRA